MSTKRTAIKVTRSADFSEWYQQVIWEADLAETSAVRGCMIIKPWGYAIWDLLKNDLDRRIKETGHLNCYFPLFIPLSLLEREAAHVAGFAKEMAVVTHHRVEADGNGKLVPTGPLEEILVVRPTSETIIGEAMSSWIQSYRDLPMLLNQWANVVRWEMRPRLFLRTTEFLWQEGHTAHATLDEAKAEQSLMLEVYADTLKEVLALPAIKGEKSPGERFPGAVSTFSVEAMMQDGKALQSGTSHFLGQNFAKAANIRYQSKQGSSEYVFTTSWGVSTRLIGALIMTHADDNGLRLPPRVAPQHIVIIPMLRDENRQEVMDYCTQLTASLRNQSAVGGSLRCHLDLRDVAATKKRWEWIKKGVTLVCEIGSRDVAQSQVSYIYRNSADFQTETRPLADFPTTAVELIELFQRELFAEAEERLLARTNTEIATWNDLVDYFSHDEDISYDRRPAVVRAKWSGEEGTEEALAKIGVAIRNIPFQQTGTPGRCVVTGAPASVDVILAKAY